MKTLIYAIVFSLFFISCKKEPQKKIADTFEKIQVTQQEHRKQLKSMSVRSPDQSRKESLRISGEFSSQIDAYDAKLDEIFMKESNRVETAVSFFEHYFDLKIYTHAGRWLVKTRKAADYNPQVISALLTNTTDWGRRSIILNSMGELAEPVFAPVLKSLVSTTSNDNEKCLGLDALGHVGGENTVEFLEPYYKDPLWGIHVSAAGALEQLTGKPWPIHFPEKNPKRN